jgi:hypothetical protein
MRMSELQLYSRANTYVSDGTVARSLQEQLISKPLPSQVPTSVHGRDVTEHEFVRLLVPSDKCEDILLQEVDAIEFLTIRHLLWGPGQLELSILVTEVEMRKHDHLLIVL